MIYIKIELSPMGNQKQAKTLQEGIIYNALLLRALTLTFGDRANWGDK